MPWSTEFETGLLDDFDFTVERSFFAPDTRYNNGATTLLQWEGTTDNVDNPNAHLWFPLGKGWESRDGGKSIEHESGKEDKYFVGNSLMARLIKRCMEDFDIAAVLDERAVQLGVDPDRGYLYSGVWETLKFHIKSEIVEYGGGNIDPMSKQMPNRFLGVVDLGNTSGAGPAKASSSSAADKIAAAKAKAAKKNGSGDLRAQVISTLKANDFDVDSALELPGVSDDTALLDALLDDSSELWTEARA